MTGGSRAAGTRTGEWPTSLPGRLDEPEDGADIEGPVYWVRGYAPPVASGLARVSIRLNGRRIGLARIGCVRLDIAGITDHPHAAVCGFEFLALADDLPRDGGTVEITAEATGLDGSVHTIGRAHVSCSWEPRPYPPRQRRRAVPQGARRVLVVTHGLGIGGGSSFVIDLVQRLVRWHGFEVSVLSLGAAPRRGELESLDVEVVERLGLPLDDPGAFGSAIDELASWGAARGMGVVLANTLAAFPGVDLAEKAGLPSIWAIHEGQGPDGFWEVAYAPGQIHPAVRSLARRYVAEAHALVFAAEATRRLFEREARGRTHVIPYGVDFDALRAAAPGRAEARRRLGVDSDALGLCLGLLEPRKGQTILAQAFTHVVPSDPGLGLALVGEWGPNPYREGLGLYLRRSGLDRHVAIIPITSQPIDWLVASDLLVSASDVESMPFVLLEAMAVGTPVLGTRVFGVPELIEEGVTGYLSDPCDVASLRDAIVRARAASEHERRKMTDAAEAWIRTRHDPRTSTAAYASLLHAMLAESG